MGERQVAPVREAALNIGDRHMRAPARKHGGYSVIGQVVLAIGLCMVSFAASAQFCPTGKILCDGPTDVGCVDASTDPRNCGGCGNTCATGQACTAGRCACPSGQNVCAGSCMNTSTDPRNCGSCGNICTGGQVCAAGRCVTANCPAGQALCAGSCANTSTDPRNCGSCGNTCTAGQVCTAGQCSQAGPLSGSDVFACQFTVGKLAGNTIVPTGITLTGPAGQPCTNNYGSSGFQVRPPFACAFTVGKLAGDTIVPTGINLTGPAGASCADNYGSSGTQVPAQN